MNRRTALAAMIAIPVMPKARVIWVYYSDWPMPLPWTPHWVKCRLDGEKAIRLDSGKGYFVMSHVRKHLYWIEERYGAKLQAPANEDSRRCCPPQRLPF